VSTIDDLEKQIAALTRAEQAELAQRLVQALGDAFPGIESTAGVCGGEPCIVRTRIPVWVLEAMRRQGVHEGDILRSYPILRVEDLANAWRTCGRTEMKLSSRFGITRALRTMARFYANENFPLPVVEQLRRLGHDVTTVQETGRGSQQTPDDVVLQVATADRRAVLTLNRKHFIRLHHANSHHAGIVTCTVDADFEGQALRIHDAVAGVEVLAGRLVRVNRPPA